MSEIEQSIDEEQAQDEMMLLDEQNQLQTISQKNESETSSISGDDESYYTSDDEEEEGFVVSKDQATQQMRKTSNHFAFSIPNVEEKGRKKNAIGPQLPEIQKSYSLLPDMATGWRPKMLSENIPSPIALYFGDSYLNSIISKVSRQSGKLKYQGKRPKTSFDLHGAFCGKDKYSFKFSNILFDDQVLKQYRVQIKEETQQKEQKVPLTDFMQKNLEEGKQGEDNFQTLTQFPAKKGQIKFDSHFEGGNLDFVIQVSESEYDLYLRPDTNTKGHYYWFYFKISNVAKDQKIKLNICNLSSKKSLYQRVNEAVPFQGLKPYISSRHERDSFETDWKQGGNIISYLKQKGMKHDTPNYTNKVYYQLSFEYKFCYDDDEVSFATQPPFTYSNLRQILTSPDISNSKSIVRESQLCRSLSGIFVPQIDISDFSEEGIASLPNRKVIIMCARVHPGESISSQVVIGGIKYLLSTQDEEVIELRKRVIFKIIPILNVDGVVVGNSRTGFAGVDLNKEFGKQFQDLLPEVQHLRRLVKREQKAGRLLAFIDVHCNQLRQNCFFETPFFNKNELNFFKSKLLCLRMSQTCQLFKFQSCRNFNSKSQNDSLTSIFHKTLGVFYSFKFEVTAGLARCGKDNCQKQLELSDYYCIGADLIKALDQFEKNNKDFCQIKGNIESIKTRIELERGIKNKYKEDSFKKTLPSKLSFQVNQTALISELPQEDSSFQAIKQSIKELKLKLNKKVDNDSDKYSDSKIDSDQSDDDYDETTKKAIYEDIRHSLHNFKKQFIRKDGFRQNISTPKELVILLSQPKDEVQKRRRKRNKDKLPSTRDFLSINKEFCRKFMEEDMTNLFTDIIGNEKDFNKKQTNANKVNQFILRHQSELDQLEKDERAKEYKPRKRAFSTIKKDSSNDIALETTHGFGFSVGSAKNKTPQLSNAYQTAYVSPFKQEISYTFQRMPLILEEKTPSTMNYLQQRRRSLTPLKEQETKQIPQIVKDSNLEKQSQLSNDQIFKNSLNTQISMHQAGSNKKSLQFNTRDSISKDKYYSNNKEQQHPQLPLNQSADPYINAFTSNLNALLLQNSHPCSSYVGTSKNNYNNCKNINNMNSYAPNSDSKVQSASITTKSSLKKSRDASFDLSIRPFQLASSSSASKEENNENQIPYTSLPYKSYQAFQVRKNNAKLISSNRQKQTPQSPSIHTSSFLI